MSDVKKNLIFGRLLDIHGFKMIFQSHKVSLIKNDMCVRKGYVKDGLRKLNAIDVRSIVMTNVKSKAMNKTDFSTYLLESSNF